MPVRIDYYESGLGAATKRDMQSAMRSALIEVGHAHHRDIKPRKFKRSAATRYNYDIRGRGYIVAKIRRKTIDGVKAAGEGLDLVFSGRSRASVMGSRKVDTFVNSAERGRAEVIMPAPTLNFPGWTGIDMRGELERTIPSEEKEVFDRGRVAYAKRLDRIKRRKVGSHKG